MRLKRFGAMATLAVCLACGKAAEDDQRQFPLRGKVVSVDRAAGTVTVDHEDIEDFMPGMTMPFPLKDAWAFDALEPGDRLDAILVVSDDGFWLEQLVISSPPSTDSGIDAPPMPRPGDPVPDVELVNQDGETIHLSDYQGKALLITFIYTRCPLPDFCPRMTEHFLELEGRLREDPELYERTHLLTISFDPEVDTPAKLRTYALARIREDALEHWEFATGDHENVRELASFLQLSYTEADGEIVHNLRTAAIAPDGTLFELYTGNSWSPDNVLDALASMQLAGDSSPP